MNTFNICGMPVNQRRDIELSRQAALLVNNLRTHKISRGKINSEIELLDLNEREILRSYINKYL
jgi:hypothetical protein